MNFIKLKKGILRFTIEIALIFGTFKLSQDVVDLFNQKQIVEYENIIDDFVNLMKSEGIENPIEIFDYYNYTLRNGYLSNRHVYRYDTDRDLFINNYGISCTTGKGVCLNQSDLLSLIFKKYGYDAYNVNCYVPDTIDINSNCIEQNIFQKSDKYINQLPTILTPITKLVGNHSITCVKYNDKFYYLDSTNLAYLEKTDLNTLEVINGSGSYEIKYFATMLYGDLKSLEIINNSGFNYIELLNDENLNINLKQLEQFYDAHSNSYKLINDQLEKKNQIILYIIAYILTSNAIKITPSILKIIRQKIIDLSAEKSKVKRIEFIDVNSQL